ncbi:MAG: ribonuclease R [Cyanobacteria bacterium]|nr:ribonuclease R [Cyanobacteriota bacterium]MDW8201675.1 ribonuclease R [Cyanobacteriota bacterium SKYGB_h_bin112]
MEKGTLVEFRQHNDVRLAVVDRPEGKKHWIVIDDRGQHYTLHPREVTYTVSGQSFKPADIVKFKQTVQSYLDPSGLEVAWELLVEDNQTTSPAELADILFSDRSPEYCYAAHCLLSADKLYFKQKGDRYEPRSANQVAELKHQQAVTEQKQQEWQTFLNQVTQLIEQTSSAQGQQVPLKLPHSPTQYPANWDAKTRSRIESVERFATLGEEATQIAQAREILAALHRPETPQAAFQLLVDLGLWHPHENLFLRRSQIPVTFLPEVLAVAHSCLNQPVSDIDADHRLDLTHLKVYTIDDESTREIDDGLSIEDLSDGRQRLWIHIADPTRLIHPGDTLDLEARRRGTTVYLPTGMIPMFPPELATGPMSLVQGQTCYALSFGVILRADGAIADYCIHPTLIRPTYRLTYEDVDEILQLGVQAEPEIAAIAEWATCRQQWRLSQGAISINMPESSIKVHNDDISINVLDSSAARQLVAEMMILAGEVAGLYGQTHNLAIPFRQQPQPELPPEEELLQLPAGPVRFSAMRRCMPRSEISITPARHASLGLDTYTQVTSPIRRYSDLLAHFQIKAHLRGDALPFSAEQMQELLLAVSTTTSEATLVERQTNRYWGLEYLRRHPDEVWHALMLRWLRDYENLGLIMLEDLGLELAMRFQRSVQPGDRFLVKVVHVDPRQDIIQFQDVGNVL